MPTLKVMTHPTRSIQLTSRQTIDSNLVGVITWSRLIVELRRSGEIRDGEEVEALVLTDDGVQLYMRAR